jgi:asparagine synthetase B (glutamine-hydrolysing)
MSVEPRNHAPGPDHVHAAGGAPVACGAIGELDPEAVERMRAAFGSGLTEAHRDARSLLLLDREPVRWKSDGAAGVAWSERLPQRASGASGWVEAATAGACGLVIDGERRAVHASASGVGPLYWRALGTATYFATAIHPLALLGGGSLAPDWESWASIIAFGYPCGDGTPFAAIKRLGPLGVLEHSPGEDARVDRGRLAWAEVEPGDDTSDVPERIVSGIAAEIDQLDPRVPLASLLSAGLDSRLLLTLLAGRELELSAWTTDTEEGRPQEQLAAAVAARLGVPHSTVHAVERPFADELRDAATLVEHESMLHLPMARLARSLPAAGGAVVNGLGGDTFVKGLVLTEKVVGAADWRGSVEALLERFAPVPPVAFQPGAWEQLRATAVGSFMGEAERFAGHPAAATLTYYWTRTRRGISQSAMKLFGGRYEVVAPFVSDEVVRAALVAPQRSKLDGALHRRVLEHAHAEVAALPSSDDGRQAPPAFQRRSERSPESRLAYRSLLLRSPLRPWFSDQLRDGLSRGRLGGEIRSHFGLRRVQGICTLTLWLDRYGSLVSDPDPAPLLGAGPKPSP